MKKFFAEFKTFITRGNVMDMAVGVIVGGAFTGIVNGLSNYILKPIINWILALVLGQEGLSGAITFLSKVEVDGVVDLANSIYIDWGAFISAIINFLLIALVLFSIVRVINHVRERNEQLSKGIMGSFATKEEKKEMKKLKLNYRNRDVLENYRAEKKAKEEAEKAAADLLAQQQAEEAKKHTTEYLLEEIKKLLEAQVAKK